MMYVWTDTDEATRDALARALALWRGTPYESGQSVCGLGADCISSVFGVVQEYLGLTAKRITLPPDTAMHNRAKAMEAMRSLLSQFQHVRVEKYVKPGDIVVMASLGGGPQHIGIVGLNRNEMWHAIPGAGFCSSALAAPSKSMRISAVYRVTR